MSITHSKSTIPDSAEQLQMQQQLRQQKLDAMFVSKNGIAIECRGTKIPHFATNCHRTL